jgi:SAM-dependent methyltransferase
MKTSETDVRLLSRETWEEERVTRDGVSLALTDPRQSDAVTDDHTLQIYKSIGLLEQYGEFFRRHRDEEFNSIVEIGIWNGGSVALWNEVFRPTSLVAVDYVDKPLKALDAYIDRLDLRDRIHVYGGVNQADSEHLRSVVLRHSDRLDLVIDDASHQYLNTRKSFEALYPLLRPGGLYIIEDWAWGYWAVQPDPDLPLAVVARNDGDSRHGEHYDGRQPLHQLVHELIKAAGSSWAVASVTVCQNFVVVERSDQTEPDIDRYL